MRFPLVVLVFCFASAALAQPVVPPDKKPMAKTSAPANELEWAREIADSFLHAVMNTSDDQIQLLVTDRMWRGPYPYRALYRSSPTRDADRFTRASITREVLAPERDEARFVGTMTGPNRAVEFKVLVQKSKEGKWRVDSFVAAETPESLEKKASQDAEAQWAKQVAADFLAGWGKDDRINSRVFLSSDLAKSLKDSNVLPENWIRERRGHNHYRDETPTFTAVEIAPAGDEAHLVGTITNLEGCHRHEFQIRLVKEKNRRVLTFQTKPLTMPPQKRTAIMVKIMDKMMDKTKCDAWHGWLPNSVLAELDLNGNEGLGVLDKTRLEAVWKSWAHGGAAPPVVDFATTAPVFLASKDGYLFRNIIDLRLEMGSAKLIYDVHQLDSPAGHFHFSLALIPRAGIDSLEAGTATMKLPAK